MVDDNGNRRFAGNFLTAGSHEPRLKPMLLVRGHDHGTRVQIRRKMAHRIAWSHISLFLPIYDEQCGLTDGLGSFLLDHIYLVLDTVLFHHGYELFVYHFFGIEVLKSETLR